MRGQRESCGSLFSYVSIEERIPDNHPPRRMRKLSDQALDRLNPSFCALHTAEGRPSVPPEQMPLTAAGVLRHPLGAAAVGAAQLQPAVSLVCVAEPRVYWKSSSTESLNRFSPAQQC
jgi:hypothetical protein